MEILGQLRVETNSLELRRFGFTPFFLMVGLLPRAEANGDPARRRLAHCTGAKGLRAAIPDLGGMAALCLLSAQGTLIYVASTISGACSWTDVASFRV